MYIVYKIDKDTETLYGAFTTVRKAHDYISVHPCKSCLKTFWVPHYTGKDSITIVYEVIELDGGTGISFLGVFSLDWEATDFIENHPKRGLSMSKVSIDPIRLVFEPRLGIVVVATHTPNVAISQVLTAKE